MTARAPHAVSVVIGPDGHGVVRHALAVAAAADVAVIRSTDASGALGPAIRGAAVVHLHFTDRLFGPDAATSARVFGQLADALPGRSVVTLHDVPEPTGTAHSTRRVDAYREVARHADVLVVCSEHERLRLRAIGIDTEASVVPLPIATPPVVGRGGRRRVLGATARSVGVLGFVYPGKGHDAVIDASAALPADVYVVALGQVSVGHEDLLPSLGAMARRAGRRLTISGWLDDDELARAMQLVDVPVVPAAATSASSSLGTWIAAGRRPLAAVNGFTCEIAALAPDLLTLYRPRSPGALAAAIAQSLTDPASTWHAGTVPGPLGMDSVAACHTALYRRTAERR